MKLGIHHNMRGPLYFFIVLLLIFFVFIPATVLATTTPVQSKLQASTPLVSNLKTVDLMVGDKISDVKIMDIYLMDAPQDVTENCQWSVSNSNVVTVDLKGVITGKVMGSSTVTAEFNNQKVSFKVKVIPIIEGINIVAKSSQLDTGKTLSVQAVVYDNNNKKTTVTTKATWSSNNENVATVGRGIIKGINNGTATISATYVIAGKTYSSTFIVTVNRVFKKLQASRLTSSDLKSVDLISGNTISDVSIMAIYVGNEPLDVTKECQWDSSSTKVATVDSNGAITGKEKGSATITATFNNKKVTFKVNVIPKIESFVIEAKSIMIEKGKTLSTNALVYYDNNTKVTVTTKAMWSSDNESIATVSKGIIKGIGKGTAKITATYVIAPVTYTATYAVDVNSKLTELISTPLTVGVNGNVTPVVQATYLEEDAPIDVTSSCTFKSSSSSIATVNYNSGLITGVKKGNVTITATYNNKKVAINVTVTESENSDQPKWSVIKDVPDSQSIIWPSISSDGNTIVGLDARYCDLNKYNDTCEIKVYEFSGEQWQSPKIIGNNGIKSSFPLVETHPVISGDGKTIMYLGHDSVDNMTRYYQVIKDPEGIWSNPTIVESIPDIWPGILTSLDSTGTTFSYLQGTGGFFGGTQTLFIVEKKDGVWQQPKAISAPGYSGASESPSLSSDGTKVAWVQANTFFDVMFTEKVNGEWLEPTVLTHDDEYDQKVTLSGDGKTILFTKIYMNGNVMESYDLFSITRNAGSWGEAVKINNSKETPTGIYDSQPATNFSGSRVIYTHFVVHTEGQDSVINEGYLVASYYKDGKWTNPTAITSTNGAYGCYHYSSELTSDGNKAIFCSPNGLSYITTAT